MPLIVLALAARDDGAGSWARSCGVRPSRRPRPVLACAGASRAWTAHRDVQDPAQLDHRARLHLRVGCGLLAQPAPRASCTSRCGVLGLQIWPTGSARGERPPRDFPCGVRIVDAGFELPGRAAPAQ
eukprot:scaffold2131_cov59-Phaeocystis_antarctica.AAC.1